MLAPIILVDIYYCNILAILKTVNS